MLTPDETSNNGHQIGGHGRGLDHQAGQTPSDTNIPEQHPHTQNTDQMLMEDWINGNVGDTEMCEPGQWMDWSGFGFGGGFVPNTENFTFYDNFWGPEERTQ